MRCVIAVTLSLLAAASGYAQTRDTLATLEGRIRDATDSGGVSFAEVRLAEGRVHVRTDGIGKFKISGVPTGAQEIFVRSLGYAPMRVSAVFEPGQTLTRELYLVRVPQMLSQMVVRGKSMRVPRGFEQIYRRGTTGDGAFITREQIDSLNPRDISSVLFTVPFVHIEAFYDVRVTTHRCKNVGVWLNGMPATDTAFIRNILTFMAPTSIQAIEVYDGFTRIPPQFARTSGQLKRACAVIVLWTR